MQHLQRGEKAMNEKELTVLSKRTGLSKVMIKSCLAPMAVVE